LIETLSHNLYEQVGRKGFFSAEIFNAANRILGNVPGKKVTLADNVPLRLASSFSPATLIPVGYRIDVLWNDHSVWRTFITIVDWCPESQAARQHREKITVRG
jgi:hypothetical protein